MTILEGRWQDWLLDGEKLGEVIAGTPDAVGFDAIFVDTFAEGYEGEFCFSRWRRSAVDQRPSSYEGEDPVSVADR